ncbi:MAG: lipid-A-disaccharide synthase [Bacteroidales bacterium]|nr:lipid-A-disaccharide synthase [Bacteroidales bacterium]MDD4216845.1 lipid-A-disaccharide synthase [Bacteroidales bacterium]MDY0142260.1 lipid-A-disaccharide synthase [Bacteroidales bacterium]
MKYFILAGEASGDLHGSYLIREIKKIDDKAIFHGWGGDLLEKEGMKIFKHIRELAFMGFVEVLQNILTIQKNFKICKKQIKEFNPDVVIFIDYPGFNLRMAKWTKKNDYKSLYFISPNAWAWKASRVFKVRDYTDRMYTILPFEKEFYASYNIDVEYFGHPLVDVVNEHKKSSFDEFCEQNNLEKKPIIALMAGSRKQEIKQMLPIMAELAQDFTDYQFVITGAPAIDREFYLQFIENKPVKLLSGKTYDILSHSTAGLITSGTATLEAALFNLPQIVCYKGGTLSVMIARIVANVKYISLVNLILDKNAVKELIQKDLTKKNLTNELINILPKGKKHNQIKENYLSLSKKLDQPGVYKRIAANMLNRVSKK